MKDKTELFDDYYNLVNDIVSNVQKSEFSNYKKIRNKFLIETIALVIIIALFIYLIRVNNLTVYYEIVVGVLSLILVIGLFIVNIKLLKKEKINSCYIVNATIYSTSLNYLTDNNFCFELNTELSQNDFNKMNLFNMNYLKYTGSNLTAASYKNKRLVMCDVCLYDLIERIKTDSYYSKSTNTTYITNYHYHDKIDIFKGLYYETKISRDNNKYIYMIPNNFSDKFIQKNIYHYISYNGTKIELENLEFSEKYSVFSFDEIKSRYVLSLTLMEKINKLDRLINNKKYFVFKPDGRVGIFIDGFRLEELFSQTFDLNKNISKTRVRKIFNVANKLLDVVEILED